MAMADVPFNPEIWHKHILPLLAPRYLGRASAVSKPWARCCAVHVKKLVAVSKLKMLPGLSIWLKIMVFCRVRSGAMALLCSRDGLFEGHLNELLARCPCFLNSASHRWGVEVYPHLEALAGEDEDGVVRFDSDDDSAEAKRRFWCPEMDDANEFHLDLAETFGAAFDAQWDAQRPQRLTARHGQDCESESFLREMGGECLHHFSEAGDWEKLGAMLQRPIVMGLCAVGDIVEGTYNGGSTCCTKSMAIIHEAALADEEVREYRSDVVAAAQKMIKHIGREKGDLLFKRIVENINSVGTHGQWTLQQRLQHSSPPLVKDVEHVRAVVFGAGAVLNLLNRGEQWSPREPNPETDYRVATASTETIRELFSSSGRLLTPSTMPLLQDLTLMVTEPGWDTVQGFIGPDGIERRVCGRTDGCCNGA